MGDAGRGSYCIIGAGACGLAVAKNFALRNIPFDCFEALSDVGGIWNPRSPHAVYGSTYLNSSDRLTRYVDFPFPENAPYYLSAAQAEDYLRAYAHAFGLYDKISFNARVVSAERSVGGWEVLLEGDREPRLYRGLVVANGHHWQPNIPHHRGHFDGEILHSHDLKTKEKLKGKRVLVVGCGNSAVDILSDAALDGVRAVHSMRRSPYFFPKVLFGKPTDVIIDVTSRIPLPRRLMYRLYALGMRALIGRHERYGLPAPDHGLFEAHPTAGNLYLDQLIHGRIAVKPDIERLDGKRVCFIDGSAEDIDLTVYATGYRVSFPFMDEGYILNDDGTSKLFIHAFDRAYDDLFVVGLFDPAEGGVWQIADYQAQLIASFIVAKTKNPARAAWFRALKASAKPDIGHGILYRDTPWHKFEIQHYRFRRYMQRLIRKFGDCATQSLAPDLSEAKANSLALPAKLKLAS